MGTTERPRDFRMFALIRRTGLKALAPPPPSSPLQLDEPATETPKRVLSSSLNRAWTLSLARGDRWYFKVNAVKEEVYIRESNIRGRCLVGRGVKGRATKCRRPWDYRRSYSGYHNRALRHAFSWSPISRGHSAGAPCKMGFSTCARAATIRRKRISEIAAAAGVPRSFFVLFPFRARIPKPDPSILPHPTAFSVLSVIYFRNEESTYLRGESIRDARAAFDRAFTNVEIWSKRRVAQGVKKVLQKFSTVSYVTRDGKSTVAETDSELSGNGKLTQKHNLHR